MRPAVLLAVLLLAPLAGAGILHGQTPGAPEVADPADASHRDAAPGVPIGWVWSQGRDGADDPPATAAALAWLTARDMPRHHYRALDMVSFIADAATATALREAVGGRVDAAESYPLHLDRSVPAIGADLVREAVGPAREGPSVVVVDTGVDGLHPDFQRTLVANLAAERVGGLVVGTFTPDVVVDVSGHGTHVTGIVAGSGAALGPLDALHDRYVGVYANGRVISFQATSLQSIDAVDSLAALEAFDWSLQNQDRYDVRVVTNSWGIPGDLDPGHPVNEATLRLYLAGINVIFSAGNLGQEAVAEQLNRFCQAPWVLCVAGGTRDGGLLAMSSRGDPAKGRPYAHPDITAPGSRIEAAAAITDLGAATRIGGLVPSVTTLQPTQSLYIARTGTSMAAPHVAGVAALLVAANPTLSPDQVMDILVATAAPIAVEVHEGGAGFLDAREAYNLAVRTPGELDAFLRGQVKYAGALSGDPAHADDPVSVGYDGTPVGGGRLLAAPQDAWVGTQAALWVLAAAGVILVAAGLRVRRGPRA